VIASRDYAYTDAASAHRALIQSVTTQAGAKTTYTYKDAAAGEDGGRLVKARTQTSGGALVEEFAYVYDEAGNMTRRTRTTPTTTSVVTFAYNQANQLCWRYSSAVSSVCGSPPAGTITYVYDAAGSMLSGDQGSQSLAYDALGRTSSIGGASIQSSRETSREMKSYTAGTPTNYQYTLLGLTREATGSTVTSIVRHPENRLPVSEKQGGVKRYFIQDAIGSTIGMLDASAGGSIPLSFTYSPDGNESWSGSGPVTNQRFAGGQRMPNTFVYHFGDRFYDPTIARWTQQDPYLSEAAQYDASPWRDLAQTNRYVYARGNPVNFTDRSGRRIDPKDACEAGVIAGGLAGELVEPAGGGALGAPLGCIAASGAAKITNAIFG
jgi:RHS repeat-associated protein